MLKEFVDHQDHAADHSSLVDEESLAFIEARPTTPLPGSQPIEFDGHARCEPHSPSAVDIGSEPCHSTNEAQVRDAGLASNQVCDDHAVCEFETVVADRIDQATGEILIPSVDPVLIATIIMQWRRRRAWHRAEKSLTLQAKALCQGLAQGGDKKEAEVVYKAAIGKGEHAQAEMALAAILPLVEGRDGIEKHRKAVEKRLAKLAIQLPVKKFVLETRGVGIASLAAIVGEAGDLSNYANPAKLWKRMGLAVMPDGTRQRRVSGEAAVAHGYVPERRSVMWNIGACIIKAGGPLKEIYDARKAYELERVPTKAQAHNRAQRYVEKRFLKLLWSEWRRQAICSQEP